MNRIIMIIKTKIIMIYDLVNKNTIITNVFKIIIMLKGMKLINVLTFLKYINSFSK